MSSEKTTILKQMAIFYNTIPKWLKSLVLLLKHYALKQSILTLNVLLVIKMEKTFSKAWKIFHHMYMFLAYSQKSILEHKNPQCIGVQEKVMQNFTDTEETKIRDCLNVKKDELIYTSKGAFSAGQQYSAGEVAIISYEEHHCFWKIRSVCFFKSDIFLISDICQS